MKSVNINIKGKYVDFPKYWIKCVGGGHAALGLRKDYQDHLKKVRDELSVEYIRFHGLLCEDMQVVRMPFYRSIPGYIGREFKKRLSYSFYHIDQLFDFILSIGMKPIVEIGFMPEILASGKKTVFYYNGNITPPKNYTEWNKLIHALIEHWADRYGIEELKAWYFEVWNEPDLSVFWAGSQKEYFKLYENTAKTIKSVNPDLKVGGPATSHNRWIPELREFCKNNDIPLDFISTHHYPADVLSRFSGPFSILKMVLALVRRIKKKLRENPELKEIDFFHDPDYSKNAFSWEYRGVLTKQVKNARHESGNLPLFYTEWGVMFKLDEIYEVPYMIKTIIDNQSLVDLYSMWTFSDEFEEMGFKTKPFNNAFGMLTIHGIPKPRYWGCVLLNQLAPMKLDIPTTISGSRSIEYILTKNKDDSEFQLLIFNQHPPDELINEDIDFALAGIDNIKFATIQRIDEDHGNPVQIWRDMGEPRYLKEDEVQDIIHKSKVKEEKFDFNLKDDVLSFNLRIPENGVILLKFKNE